MTLFPVGSWVCIADNIKARVQQICIHENECVEYECVWWTDADRKTAWLPSFEVRPATDTLKTEIGFITPTSPKE